MCVCVFVYIYIYTCDDASGNVYYSCSSLCQPSHGEMKKHTPHFLPMTTQWATIPINGPTSKPYLVTPSPNVARLHSMSPPP